MKGGQRRGGANFLSLSFEFREATCTNVVTHKCAEYVHTGDWTGVTAIAVAFSHPQDMEDNTVWLQEQRICHLEWVFCSCFLCTRVSLSAACILPWRPSQHSSVVSAQSLSPFPFLTLCLPPLHPISPCTAETSQVCSSCASSGAVYHGTASGSPRDTTQHACRALETFATFHTWCWTF